MAYTIVDFNEQPDYCEAFGDVYPVANNTAPRNMIPDDHWDFNRGQIEGRTGQPPTFDNLDYMRGYAKGMLIQLEARFIIPDRLTPEEKEILEQWIEVSAAVILKLHEYDKACQVQPW
jgi:hypothetical protein